MIKNAIDYKFNDSPKCPYCGYEDEDWYQVYDGSEDGGEYQKLTKDQYRIIKK